MTMSMNTGENKIFRFNNEELIVDKENSDVVYNDEKHVYVGKNGIVKDKKFTSVTTLIGMFEHEFDGEFWSKYKALEALRPDEFKDIKSALLDTKTWSDAYLTQLNVTKEEFEQKIEEIKSGWKDKNKEACEHGTRVHAKQEQGFYSDKDKMIQKFNIGGKFDVCKNHHVLDMERGIIPEMLLTYQSKDGLLRIAGQSDLVIKDGNRIKIFDYKTNRELKFKSYYDPKKKSYEMMKYPLNNLMDCNVIHYTLQLSTYAWMIQKSNPELVVDELKIIHFTHDGQRNEYQLNYLRDDVIRMLKYYKRSLAVKDLEERNKPVIF